MRIQNNKKEKKQWHRREETKTEADKETRKSLLQSQSVQSKRDWQSVEAWKTTRVRGEENDKSKAQED